MSKYIRTKNRIWKTEDVILIDEEHDEILWQKILRKPWFYIQEVKQADTLEELVDELVVVEPNNEDCPRPYILDCFHLCTYNSWFEREKEHIKIGTIVVYGSIWVDGDLIRVAKMNEKGELELL